MRRFVLVTLLVFASAPMRGAVYQLAELSSEKIRSLDRTNAVVIIPGGIIEEHGPYLPTFTDGYWNERVTGRLANALSNAGRTVVIFPMIPLGNSGANDIGARFNYPGTYAVSFRTLRSVFLDLATDLGEQGFRNVFIIHLHGAPNHQRALDQASDYFNDTYGGTMVNLTGLLPVLGSLDGEKSAQERAEDGLVIHAGMDETSMMLFVKPNLVTRSFLDAKPASGTTMPDLITLAKDESWRGYFGSPRLAKASKYRTGWGRAEALVIKYALEILAGTNARTIRRFGDEMLSSAPDVALDHTSLLHEDEVAEKQQQWLRAHSLQ